MSDVSSSPPWIGAPGRSSRAPNSSLKTSITCTLALVGPDRAQGLQVRLAGLGGQDHELADACPLFPGLDKFVHDPMQRAAPERGAAGEVAGRRVDAVFHRRCAQDPEFGRQIVGQVLHDDGIAPEGQMGPVLLGGAHRHDHASAAPAAARRTAPGVISFKRQGRPG